MMLLMKRWKEKVRRVAGNHKNPKPKPEVLEKIQAKYNYRIMFFSLVQEIIAKMLQKYSVFLSPEKDSTLPWELVSNLTTLGTPGRSPLPSSRSFIYSTTRTMS